MQSLPALSSANLTCMTPETYLNHPTFGLLYRVCLLEENRELFATLYAQRLFFLVTTSPEGIQFDPVSRSDARILVESRLRTLRREGSQQEYSKLQGVHRQAFH